MGQFSDAVLAGNALRAQQEAVRQQRIDEQKFLKELSSDLTKPQREAELHFIAGRVRPLSLPKKSSTIKAAVPLLLIVGALLLNR